jgi:hypothetical protein
MAVKRHTVSLLTASVDLHHAKIGGELGVSTIVENGSFAYDVGKEHEHKGLGQRTWHVGLIHESFVRTKSEEKKQVRVSFVRIV